MKSVNLLQISDYDETFRTRLLTLVIFLLFLSFNLRGQGTGCPTVHLDFTSVRTCNLSPITISGTFGGSATSVSITENGSGSVSPRSITASPFVFTYTPKHNDNGKNVIITVTTNHPNRSCNAAITTCTITIGSGLPAPVVGTITNTSCLKQTGSVYLSGLPSGGTWVITCSPGGFKTTGTGTGTTISDLAPGVYTFTVANALGCVSGSSGNVNIVASTGGINLSITNPPAACAPSKVDLTSSDITAGSPPGLTFTYWTDAAASIPFSSPTAAGAGTYYIKGSSGGDCFDIKPVIVTSGTPAVANAGTGGHNCGLDFKFNAILTTGRGTWTKIAGPGNVAFTPNNHQPDATATVDEAGTYDFAWNVDNNSCIASDIVRVIFHELPSINTGAGTDTIICKGSGIQLHARGTGFFSWTPSELFNNPNISDPVATPIASTTLTVKLTDEFGCENWADIKVGLKDKPVANAGPDQVLTGTTDTQLNAVLYNTDDTGVWTLLKGTGELSDSSYVMTSVSGLSKNKNEFIWTVTNGFCPPSSDTVIITVTGMIIPTLITPNMDGKNDYFVIRGYNGEGKMELIVFDRRGVEVYKNLNYKNEWNGIDYNDKPLPDDTYFYILKTKSDLSLNGFIVVKR